MVTALLLCAVLGWEWDPWADTLPGAEGLHSQRMRFVVCSGAETALADSVVGSEVGKMPGCTRLVGVPVNELRFIREDGAQLRWGISTAQGLPRTPADPAIAEDDWLWLPVTCPAQNAMRGWLYVGNPTATMPGDTIAPPVLNLAFEAGPEDPLFGWLLSADGPASRAEWVPDEGVVSSGCIRITRSGAPDSPEPSLVQEAPVVDARQTVRFGAFVRTDAEAAGGVVLALSALQGTAVLKEATVQGGAAGTEWSVLDCHLRLPKGTDRVQVRAMLTQPGTAWIDDAYVDLGVAGSFPIELRDHRSLDLEDWDAGPLESEWVAELRNLQPKPGGFVFELAAGLPHGLLVPDGARLALTAPATRGDFVAPLTPLGSGLVYALLPAMTRLTCPVSVETGRYSPEEEAKRASVMSADEGNLLAGGTFEGVDLAQWGAAEPSLRLVAQGPDASTCARLCVPESDGADGAHLVQSGVPVHPAGRYYLGAMVRTGEMGGDLRVRVRARDGGGGGLGTVEGDEASPPQTPWHWVGCVLQMPPGAADVDVEVGFDSWGTAYVDDVVLMPFGGRPVVTANSRDG